MHLAGTRTGPPRAGAVWAVLDVATGLLLVVGLAVEAAVVVSRHPAWPVGAALVLLTSSACAAAFLRRRFPARAAAVAVLACAAAELVDWRTDRHGQPAPVACIALLVVVATAVRAVPSPVGAIAVAAGSGAVAIGTLERYAPARGEGVPGSRTVTLLLVAGWAVAVTVGVCRRVADARRRSMVLTVRRAERLAVARDLHDVAAHHLTGLVIQSQVAQLHAGAPPGMRAALADIEAEGVRALASLRQVVRLLREDETQLAPAPDALAELVDRFSSTRTHARLDLPDGPLPTSWPPSLVTGTYRIVQEALSNVAQHALDARSVTVTVAHDSRTVRLRIVDDGRPGPATGRHGLGLVGMRERVAALGGELTAGPVTPTGWTVEASIPVPGAS